MSTSQDRADFTTPRESAEVLFKRKEELLLATQDFNRIIVLRRVLSQLSPTEAMELLLDKLSKTKANSEFLDSMQS